MVASWRQSRGRGGTNRYWTETTVTLRQFIHTSDRSIHDLYDLDRGRHIPDLYDLAHVARYERYNLHDVQDMSPGLDLYYADPTLHPLTAG